jgi:hypothetical protein
MRPGNNAVIEIGFAFLNPAAASGSMVRPQKAATGCEVDTCIGADQMTGSDLVLKKLERVDAVVSNASEDRRSSTSLSADTARSKQPSGLFCGWSGEGSSYACNGFADLLPLRPRRIPRAPRSSAAAVLR